MNCTCQQKVFFEKQTRYKLSFCLGLWAAFIKWYRRQAALHRYCLASNPSQQARTYLQTHYDNGVFNFKSIAIMGVVAIHSGLVCLINTVQEERCCAFWQINSILISQTKVRTSLSTSFSKNISYLFDLSLHCATLLHDLEQNLYNNKLFKTFLR